jgi:hypothetical protein
MYISNDTVISHVSSGSVLFVLEMNNEIDEIGDRYDKYG